MKTIKFFKGDLRSAKSKIRPSNEESEISKLESFANVHCPTPIDLDNIQSDIECCTYDEVIVIVL